MIRRFCHYHCSATSQGKMESAIMAISQISAAAADFSLFWYFYCTVASVAASVDCGDGATSEGEALSLSVIAAG